MRLIYIVMFYMTSIMASNILINSNPFVESLPNISNRQNLSLRSDIAIKRIVNNNLFPCKYLSFDRRVFYCHFNKTLNADLYVLKEQVFKDTYIDNKIIEGPRQYQCSIVISYNENIKKYKAYLDSVNIAENLMEKLNQDLIKPGCCFWNKEIVACASYQERLIFLLNNNLLVEGVLSKSNDEEDKFLLLVNHVDQIINEAHQFNDKNSQLHYNETIQKFELVYVADTDLHQVNHNDSNQSITSDTPLNVGTISKGNNINNNPLKKSDKKTIFRLLRPLVTSCLCLGVAILMLRYFQT